MSLTNALQSTANTLRAYGQALEVVQNNVANVSTPGFVKQRLNLQARPFDAETGSGGGVQIGAIQSSRDAFAEQSVRRQVAAFGKAEANVESLTALESNFDITGEGGIPAALNSLLRSFSAWAQSPNDAISRRNVIEGAGSLAQSFQQSSANLANIANDSERRIQQTVEKINRLAGQLRGFNENLGRGNAINAAADAQIHATLEELSGYVDITSLQQDDGSVTVLLGGQVPLVVGDRQYPIAYRLEQPGTPPPLNPDARPFARISSAEGDDITSKATNGKLGALLDFRNNVLPSYIGDAYQPGGLNRLAQQIATRVNEVLTSGNISEGPPAVPGIALFTFDASDPTKAAQSLAVNPSITPGQLAAISPGPPPVANGIALALSNLTNSQDPADRIDGATYNQFFGSLASSAGRALADSKKDQELKEASLTQAKNLREQMSAVSLDEEAALMIQFQRAYEANSRLFSIIDQLTRDLMNILRT